MIPILTTSEAQREEIVASNPFARYLVMDLQTLWRMVNVLHEENIRLRARVDHAEDHVDNAWDSFDQRMNRMNVACSRVERILPRVQLLKKDLEKAKAKAARMKAAKKEKANAKAS